MLLDSNKSLRVRQMGMRRAALHSALKPQPHESTHAQKHAAIHAKAGTRTNFQEHTAGDLVMPQDMYDMDAAALPDDVEDALRRQEEALSLLERRWPTPDGVSLELHDGTQWHAAPVLDMGIGGSRLPAVPAWMLGPAPARLKAPSCAGILVLADVMWRDKKSGGGGLRFEFLSTEERDEWADSLLDALLARYSIG